MIGIAISLITDVSTALRTELDTHHSYTIKCVKLINIEYQLIIISSVALYIQLENL